MTGRADRGGHEHPTTVTATRFAELTGVSRERLRTWERRHGFPHPRRVASGPRRYQLDDVARVVAIRRAAESGVPLPDAIALTVLPAAPRAVSPDALAALVARAPMPIVALTGPAPLCIAYVNAALAALPGAPVPGEELCEAHPEFLGTPCVRMLQDIFSGACDDGECNHPGWSAVKGRTSRSALFRLPSDPGRLPLIAMVALGGDREREVRAELVAARGEADVLRARDARHVRWLDALGELAHTFQTEPAPDALDEALDALLRRLDADDAGLARYVSGELILTSSRRGLLGPGSVTLAAHPGLGRALRDTRATWLEPAAAKGLGVRGGLHAAGVPVVVGGEPLGLLLLAFDGAEEIDAEVQRLLAAVSAGVGFTLLRDRLTHELRAAVSPQS